MLFYKTDHFIKNLSDNRNYFHTHHIIKTFLPTVSLVILTLHLKPFYNRDFSHTHHFIKKLSANRDFGHTHHFIKKISANRDFGNTHHLIKNLSANRDFGLTHHFIKNLASHFHLRLKLKIMNSLKDLVHNMLPGNDKRIQAHK